MNHHTGVSTFAIRQHTNQKLQKSFHLFRQEKNFKIFSPTLLKNSNTRHASQRQKSKTILVKHTTDKDYNNSTDRTPAGNSTYKKLAIQWLNEALCFVSSLVLADSLVLRNRQLLVAANRYGQVSERQFS